MKKILLSIFLVLVLAAPVIAPEAGKPLLGRQINWSDPLTRGLVGCWLMNEGSGGRINDYSGNGNHGIVSADNAPVWTGGESGPALDWAAQSGDDYYNCGAGSSLDITGEITIVASFKPVTDQTFLTICGKEGTSSYWLFQSPAESRELGFYAGGSISYSDRPIYTVGEWCHVVCASKGAGGTLWYINGVLRGTLSECGNMASNPTDPLYIGIDPRDQTDYGFDGVLNYIYIYNRILSASEIAQLYREPFFMSKRVPIWMYKSLVVPTVGGQVITVIMQ